MLGGQQHRLEHVDEYLEIVAALAEVAHQGVDCLVQVLGGLGRGLTVARAGAGDARRQSRICR